MKDALRPPLSDVEVREKVTGWRVTASGPNESDECRRLTEVVDLGIESLSRRKQRRERSRYWEAVRIFLLLV